MSPNSTRRRAQRVAITFVLAIAVSVAMLGLPAAAAPDQVALGTAEAFAVLAGAGITNSGATVIDGDVGSHPTPAQTGFGSVVLVNGSVNQGDNAVTATAKDDLVTAYDDAFGRVPFTIVNDELGGEIFLAGVYKATTFGLTGEVTLDAQDDPDARFIFLAGSTLIAEVASEVLLINGAQPCNVVWQVGSSATFKTGTLFAGDVLAMESITAQAGAAFDGRLLARDGAVTLDTNRITSSSCPAVTTTTAAPTTTTTAAPTTTTTAAPATTTTVAQTTTTTVASTTTTTEDDSPSPSPTSSTTVTTSTTTTVAPATTTTTAPVVVPATVTSTDPTGAVPVSGAVPPGPGSSTSPVPGPSVPGVLLDVAGNPIPAGTGFRAEDGSSIGAPTVTTPGSGVGGPRLPRTGSGVTAITMPALLTIALGSAALAVERRLRASS